MWIGVLKTQTLGGRRFHWIEDWCVQHTNPWWQEVPLNWGLVCSTHQPLVAGGSTGMGGGVFNTPTLGGRRIHWIGGWCEGRSELSRKRFE